MLLTRVLESEVLIDNGTAHSIQPLIRTWLTRYATRFGREAITYNR